MKQFYYGNIYEEKGYHVLAHSDMISDRAMRKMESIAQNTTPMSGSDVCGLLPVDGGRIFFRTAQIPPKLEKGENRPTIFSHQYYIEQKEINAFTKAMPQALLRTKFDCRYSDSYDISDRKITASGAGAVRRVKNEMVNASRELLASKGHMLIYKEHMSCDDALNIMAGIAAALDEGSRKQISFVTDGASEALTDEAMFVFCSRKRYESLKSRYYKNCIYYDADNDSMIKTDEKLDLGYTGGGSSENDTSYRIVDGKKQYDDEISGPIDIEEEPFIIKEPVVNTKQNKQPFNLLYFACGLVLGLIIGVTAGRILGGRNSEKDSAPDPVPPAVVQVTQSPELGGQDEDDKRRELLNGSEGVWFNDAGIEIHIDDMKLSADINEEKYNIIGIDQPDDVTVRALLRKDNDEQAEEEFYYKPSENVIIYHDLVLLKKQES